MKTSSQPVPSERVLILIASRFCLLFFDTFGNFYFFSSWNILQKLKSLIPTFFFATLNPIKGKLALFAEKISTLKKLKISPRSFYFPSAFEFRGNMKCEDLLLKKMISSFRIIIFNHASRRINDWICLSLPSTPEMIKSWFKARKSLLKVKIESNYSAEWWLREGRWSHHGKDFRWMIKEKIHRIECLNICTCLLFISSTHSSPLQFKKIRELNFAVN